MTNQSNFPNDLFKLLNKIMQSKTYGSLEIFFENGKITQITQRIINKIQHKSSITVSLNKQTKIEKNNTQSVKEEEVLENFNNI